MSNEMRMRYGLGEPAPGVGVVFKAEVKSSLGSWAHIGHYESVAAFEKMYPHLEIKSWDTFLDTHEYFEAETGSTYRLRPIHFLREG